MSTLPAYIYIALVVLKVGSKSLNEFSVDVKQKHVKELFSYFATVLDG